MTTVNKNSQIYYEHTYWNDIPLVREHINKSCSGSKKTTWQQYFGNVYAKKPFKHGLFLLCGNGWVERDFIDQGIVKSATAFDYSKDLLDQAKAKKGERKITYFQADVNTVDLPGEKYDLVVNMAGLHHVQYLARFHQKLCKSLKINGVMASFDYIGPSRNQYSHKHWLIANQVNNQIPEIVRADLRYPDLLTMLATDPTEAINSERIIEVHRRFFSIIDFKKVGGGIAYLILTHNNKFFKAPETTQKKWASYLLKTDKSYTQRGAVPNLFAFWVSKPRKEILQKKRKIYTMLFADLVIEQSSIIQKIPRITFSATKILKRRVIGLWSILRQKLY